MDTALFGVARVIGANIAIVAIHICGRFCACRTRGIRQGQQLTLARRHVARVGCTGIKRVAVGVVCAASAVRTDMS